jgi:hypothetical protein
VQSPYLVPWMNHLWSGLWTGLVYTTSLLLVLKYIEVPEPFDYEVPSQWMKFRWAMRNFSLCYVMLHY